MGEIRWTGGRDRLVRAVNPTLKIQGNAGAGEAVGGESMAEKRVAASVEELTLSNSLQLTALVELLEEKGVLKQSDVIERMKQIRDRKKPS